MTRKLETSLTCAVEGLDLIREAAQTSTDAELQRLQSICARLIWTLSVRQNDFDWSRDRLQLIVIAGVLRQVARRAVAAIAAVLRIR